MTMMSTHRESAVRTTERTQAAPARTLWTDHDAGVEDPPEQTFAEIFGDADRVRIALWIDRNAPVHGGLFGADACTSELRLSEATVRTALGPLQRIGMVRYRGGLHMRCDHSLWAVLKVFRHFAGPALVRAATVGSSAEAGSTGTPHDARAATFYFG